MANAPSYACELCAPLVALFVVRTVYLKERVIGPSILPCLLEHDSGIIAGVVGAVEGQEGRIFRPHMSERRGVFSNLVAFCALLLRRVAAEHPTDGIVLGAEDNHGPVEIHDGCNSCSAVRTIACAQQGNQMPACR